MRYGYIVAGFIILNICVLPVIADEIEWTDPQDKTLRLMETFQRENFIIEASDFYNDTQISALITVYDMNHMPLASNITRINDSFNVNDKLNITIIDLQDRTGNISAGHGAGVTVDQWVKIRTRFPGKPVPKISILPYAKQINNKSVISRIFIPDSDIWINFSIRNEGKAVLKRPSLKINSTLPLFSGDKLDYELTEIGAGNESEVITVHFKAPFTGQSKSFKISAEARGSDIYGRAYSASDATYIDVVLGIDDRIELKKYVSEKIYMGDLAVVSIIVKNNRSQTLENVSLTDALPPGLEPLDSNLTWNFNLATYEQKSIYYWVKPQKPGTYLFLPGSSRVEYQGYAGYDKKINKLIVNGPYVVLTKSADTVDPAEGQKVTITLEARNIGDATGIVKLEDPVPMNYSLTADEKPDKTIQHTFVLHPGNSSSLSYSLNATLAGNYILPRAEAEVFDQFLYQDERYKQNITSNDLVIEIHEPSTVQTQSGITPVPKRTTSPGGKGTPAEASPHKQTGGFGGDTLIMLLIFLGLLNKMKSKR
ncbi:MAG TPA: hypothetical protein VIO58_02040 [Candidatus Methanoperedens sp.]